MRRSLLSGMSPKHQIMTLAGTEHFSPSRLRNAARARMRARPGSDNSLSRLARRTRPAVLVPALVGIAVVATSPAWRNALFQPHDLEAALPRRFLLVSCLRQIVFARFHEEPPFAFGLRYNEGTSSPARRPSAG